MRKSTEELFWEKVDKRERGCWIWTAARNRQGYGTVTASRRRWLAHRLAYTWLVGPIPEGMTIEHLCRQTACVNPGHLEAISLKENIKRGLQERWHGLPVPEAPPQIRGRYRNRPLWERFWEKVNRRGDDECWPWLAGKNGSGYGAFGLGKKWWGAHRFVYERMVGDIPRGYTVHHKCENRVCVNPAHLCLLTHRENVLLGTAPPACSMRRSHCPQGHPYEGDNLYWQGSSRRCRICTNEKERRYRRAAGLKGRKRPYCKQGHERTPENTRLAPNGQQVCRICMREWVRASRARRSSDKVG